MMIIRRANSSSFNTYITAKHCIPKSVCVFDVFKLFRGTLIYVDLFANCQKLSEIKESILLI